MRLVGLARSTKSAIGDFPNCIYKRACGKGFLFASLDHGTKSSTIGPRASFDSQALQRHEARDGGRPAKRRGASLLGGWLRLLVAPLLRLPRRRGLVGTRRWCSHASTWARQRDGRWRQRGGLRVPAPVARARSESWSQARLGARRRGRGGQFRKEFGRRKTCGHEVTGAEGISVAMGRAG